MYTRVILGQRVNVARSFVLVSVCVYVCVERRRLSEPYGQYIILYVIHLVREVYPRRRGGGAGRALYEPLYRHVVCMYVRMYVCNV